MGRCKNRLWDIHVKPKRNFSEIAGNFVHLFQWLVNLNERNCFVIIIIIIITGNDSPDTESAENSTYND
jgi:hypothetical protein